MRTLTASIVLPLLHSCSLFAQSVEVRATTATEAVVYIRDVSGTCTGTLTEVSTGLVHPYVNGVDLAALANYFTTSDGARVVTLGRQVNADALAAETEYELSLTGCTTHKVRFRTSVPYFGVQPGRNAPFDSGKYGNRGWPGIDWTIAGKNKTYTDPLTGVKLKLLPSNGDIGWKTDAGGIAFAPAYAGGAGWANADRVGNGSTSNYGSVTDSTTPLDLFVPINQSPWRYSGMAYSYPAGSLDNLGLIVWCSGNDAAAENRQVKLSIWNGTHAIAWQVLTCPQGSVAKLNSTSADADRPWPKEFDDGGFAGWQGGGRITRDLMPQDGTLTVSGGSTLQVSDLGIGSNIPATTRPGARILLPASGCANDLCTFASVTNAGSAVIQETAPNTSYSYVAYPWSVRVEKTTSSGTLNIGLKWKVQGTPDVRPGTTAAALPHPVPVTSGDGKAGTLNLIAGNHLYFISDDFTTFRGISIFYETYSKFAAMPAADKISFPNAPYVPVYPSETEAGVFYIYETAAGGKSLYKITYAGDYTEDYVPGLIYNMNNSLGFPVPADKMKWENIMPASQNKDLVSQAMAYVASHGLTSNEWYGFNGAMSFSGISGTKAFFYAVPGIQDTGPCLMAVVELTTGTLENMFSTATGPGDAENYPAQSRWGACHNTAPSREFQNSIGITTNALQAGGNLYGGPFEVTPNAVKMPDGSWNSNTALAWPLDAAANTFDRSCPSDAPEWIKDYGANGNQCVTLKLPSHPCQVSPNATALAQQPPCPGFEGQRTMPQQLQIGDRAYNEGTGAGDDRDTEHFRVVKITPLGGNETEVVWQRNAVWDYCCINHASSPRSPYCVGAPWQFTHATGFTLRMHTGQTNSCGNTGTMFTFGAGGALTYSGEGSRSTAGHTAIGRWVDGKKLFIGGGGNSIVESLAQLHTKFPQAGTIVHAFPSFAGIASNIGSNAVQSYLNRSHSAADPLDLQWSLDANALNNGNGTESIGPRTITPVADMPGVYEIEVKGTFSSYKKQPLHAWAGWNVMKDTTGAGNVGSAPDFSVCYNYTAGLCGTGPKGKVYVKVPRAWYADGQCQTGNFWGLVPCVYAGEPVTGWIRRTVSHIPNVRGQMTQNLTMGLAGPGLPSAFWGAAATATGKAGATYSSSYIDGMRSKVVLFKMPSYTGPRDVAADYARMPVQIGARNDMTHARVRFGYDAAFHCTEGALECVTDRTAEPFAFDGQDTLTPALCSGGCTIPVPVIPGRLVYYRVESFDGLIWTPGDTMVAVMR